PGGRLLAAPGVVHRWRHHRDGAQRRQRTRARHAEGALARPRRRLPRRAAERLTSLLSAGELPRGGRDREPVVAAGVAHLDVTDVAAHDRGADRWTESHGP